MSIYTWREEFYPKAAEVSATKDTELQIIEHSLLKWTGLLPENLQKHDVSKMSYEPMVMDNHTIEFFFINGDTCSLCRKYFMVLPLHNEEHYCKTCSIFRVTNKSCGNEYKLFIRKDDPKPMIKLLTKVKEVISAKKSTQE